MSDVSIAAGYARRLVEREARTGGVGMRDATASVARNLKVSAGSIWGLLYAPPKQVGSELFRKLRNRVERSIEYELRALENELHILRQTGVDPRDNAFIEVETHLAKARKALGLPPSLDGDYAGLDRISRDAP